MLEPYCSEFLIHAADVEGLQQGIDEALVSKLAEWCTIPVTYAGGGRNLGDLDRVKSSSAGKVDLTIGSALDIFGGSGVTFAECVEPAFILNLSQPTTPQQTPTSSLPENNLNLYRQLSSLSSIIKLPLLYSISPLHFRKPATPNSSLSSLAQVRYCPPPSPLSTYKNETRCIVAQRLELSNHHSITGSTKDPENGPAVAASIFTAVVVYAFFMVFCGIQAFLHVRSSRRGAISLR
ncbi:1-(5-phosphoribosyl)-5-[(5-phosphoribosylamino)methylideneamino] imidazole-4-carboxamide isomerase [Emergomyces africanus]|uniref:1-(5-phosphoribosyl)-5-[(5-phosphoribosylamino)methylideneamino] imidazole-4-carboxamide isomerase n=1 Tax=Emergomyces africanus TaxID=1955775 RepID=A0A1B7NRG5_9EURO|nr:1-(5-phosphoribosyl)-5-[(5-phosphoribosylamino)methylideneamino] imidazole-4-carboxamide isomerase [Emergomyces africanus]